MYVWISPTGPDASLIHAGQWDPPFKIAWGGARLIHVRIQCAFNRPRVQYSTPLGIATPFACTRMSPAKTSAPIVPSRLGNDKHIGSTLGDSTLPQPPPTHAPQRRSAGSAISIQR